MRQAIDFSHVDVRRHLERSGALHSYPTGDDVSTFIRCGAARVPCTATEDRHLAFSQETIHGGQVFTRGEG